MLLLPGIFDIEPIITVAWSLGYRAFNYFVISPTTIWLGTIYPATGGNLWMYAWLWVPMFFATLAVSAALYLLVEHPASLARRAPRSNP
ncbi:MAG: hypothetical protein AAF545_07700 [Pseudomonadota bacterium]